MPTLPRLHPLQPLEPIFPQHDCRTCFLPVEVREQMSQTHPGLSLSCELCLLSALPGSDTIGAPCLTIHTKPVNQTACAAILRPVVVFQNMSIIRCVLLLTTLISLSNKTTTWRTTIFDRRLRATAIFDGAHPLFLPGAGCQATRSAFPSTSSRWIAFIYSMPYPWMPGPSSKSNAASLMPVHHLC